MATEEWQICLYEATSSVCFTKKFNAKKLLAVGLLVGTRGTIPLLCFKYFCKKFHFPNLVIDQVSIWLYTFMAKIVTQKALFVLFVIDLI